MRRVWGLPQEKKKKKKNEQLAETRKFGQHYKPVLSGVLQADGFLRWKERRERKNKKKRKKKKKKETKRETQTG